MKPGVTYDTGMLIALERSKARAMSVHETLVRARVRITVPVAVLGEWWRGRTDDREDLLAQIRIATTDEETSAARAAGEALAALRPRKSVDDACRCRHLVDAVVMASAARRGDVVYTSDVEDLLRLQVRFPSVRVLGA